MGRSVEKVGKTVQDAIAAALDALRLTVEDVHVDVLEEGKTGLFGILSGKQARVRVTELDEEEKMPQPDFGGDAAAVTGVVAAAPVMGVRTDSISKPSHYHVADSIEPDESETGAFGSPDDAGEGAEYNRDGNDAGEGDYADEYGDDYAASNPDAAKAIAFLDELLDRIGISASLYAEPTEEGFQINMESDDSGILIGHRGETLDAFQYLLNLYTNKGRDTFLRVSVDVEHYKKKREASLKRLADRMAEKVVRLKRNFTLEPMNSYERRIVHSYLQNNPKVETYSVGEEPNRKVMVTLKNGRGGSRYSNIKQ